MITFFTTAKSFHGPARISQINALRSWRTLHPDVEIILFGKGEGYSEVSGQLGLVHIPEVETNEFGVPRIDSMFSLAAKVGRHKLQAYINCDIILLSDFVDAVKAISFKRFLLVSQRWEIDIKDEISFQNHAWQNNLKKLIHAAGSLSYPGAIDVFLTKGDVWQDLPPMVVGRGMYDQWLIYYCRSNKIAVVDASEDETMLHPRHDYSHIVGGHLTVEIGAEASRNLELGGGLRHMFTIQDADWRLTAEGVVRNWCRGDSERYGEVYEILHEKVPGYLMRVMRLGAEIECECRSRWLLARKGKIMTFCKLPLWLARRLVVAKRFPYKTAKFR